MNKADIGVVGLAVMCENLGFNMEGHGFIVSVYNRTVNRLNYVISGRI